MIASGDQYHPDPAALGTFDRIPLQCIELLRGQIVKNNHILFAQRIRRDALARQNNRAVHPRGLFQLLSQTLKVSRGKTSSAASFIRRGSATT